MSRAALLVVMLAVVPGCKRPGAARGGEACKADLDCEHGLRCLDGVCRGSKGAGQACTTTPECAEGLCVDGMCRSMRKAGAPCTAQVDCAGGLACIETKCADVAARAEEISRRGCDCGEEAGCYTRTAEELGDFLKGHDKVPMEADGRRRVEAAKAALAECTRKAVFGH